MKKKLILWISLLFMGKLMSMHVEIGESNWDLLSAEIKLLVFEYVAGRYDLDQINKAINTLSKVNKEMRHLTLDPKSYLIKTIRANFCKKITDLSLNFTRGNESISFIVDQKSYIAQFNFQNSADVRQKNIEVAQVIGIINQHDLNIFIKDLVLKLRDKTDEELLPIAMTLAQSYIYSQMNHNNMSVQNIRSIAQAIFDLFKCKESLNYKNKVTFGLI